MADKIYDVYHQEIELTSEQEACLKYTGNRTLMVKGYAAHYQRKRGNLY